MDRSTNYDQARQFREAAELHNEDRSRLGWRYPPNLRGLAVAYCRSACEGGRSKCAIAADLGITTLSLSRWLADSPATSLLPVQVKPTPAPSSTVRVVGDEEALTAITPGGLRIEGLDWRRLMQLVRVFG